MVMNATTNELTSFFESVPYQELLVEACAILGLSINDSFPEILYEYDKKKLVCSELTLPDLASTVAEFKKFLLPFIVLKFRDAADDLDGEFPSDELPGDEDCAEIVQSMPVYRNFLFGYIIEFTILNARTDFIAQYLKCVRIPHALAYSKRLKQWFSRVRK